MTCTQIINDEISDQSSFLENAGPAGSYGYWVVKDLCKINHSGLLHPVNHSALLEEAYVQYAMQAVR